MRDHDDDYQEPAGVELGGAAQPEFKLVPPDEEWSIPLLDGKKVSGPFAATDDDGSPLLDVYETIQGQGFDNRRSSWICHVPYDAREPDLLDHEELGEGSWLVMLRYGDGRMGPQKLVKIGRARSSRRRRRDEEDAPRQAPAPQVSEVIGQVREAHVAHMAAMRAQHEAEIGRLHDAIEARDDKLADLEAKLEAKSDKLAELRAELADAKLKAQVAELRAELAPKASSGGGLGEEIERIVAEQTKASVIERLTAAQAEPEEEGFMEELIRDFGPLLEMGAEMMAKRQAGGGAGK